MNKKLASIVLAAVFTLATVGAASANVDCKVDSVDASGKVALSCDKDKAAANLKTGDAVQVTKPAAAAAPATSAAPAAPAKKKLEGC